MSITPEQSRAARALIDWTQRELATRAGIGISTVQNFEGGLRKPHDNHIKAMRIAFEQAGVIFIERSAEGGAGVRLKF